MLNGKSFQQILYNSDLDILHKQIQEQNVIDDNAKPMDVTYIQGGTTYFWCNIIIGMGLVLLFVYTIYNVTSSTRGKKCSKKEQGVLYYKLDDDDEEYVEIKDTSDQSYVCNVAGLFISPWLSTFLLLLMIAMSVHELVRVCISYEKHISLRTFYTAFQLTMSIISVCLVSVLTYIVTIEGRKFKMEPLIPPVLPGFVAETETKGRHVILKTSRSSLHTLFFGYLLVDITYGLIVSVWIMFLDDVLESVAVFSFGSNNRRLDTLLYAWMIIFVVYVVVFFILDIAWFKRKLILLPYLFMITILCEIPIRNHIAMTRNMSQLGTSLVALLLLLCLFIRIVVNVYVNREGIRGSTKEKEV